MLIGFRSSNSQSVSRRCQGKFPPDESSFSHCLSCLRPGDVIKRIKRREEMLKDARSRAAALIGFPMISETLQMN